MTCRSDTTEGEAHPLESSPARWVLMPPIRRRGHHGKQDSGALAFRARIERVDEHRCDRARAGDLDAGLLQIGGHGRDLPASGRCVARREMVDALAVQRALQEHLARSAELAKGSEAEEL
jgi:hypothetical protein